MLHEWATLLAGTSLGHGIRTSAWAYPLLEVLHLWSLAALFGAILIVDLRLLGLQAMSWGLLVPETLLRTLVPLALVAFAFAAFSGALMFLSRAPDFVSNPAFRIKLILLALTGLNALILHRRRSPVLASGNRLQAGLSILLWLGVIAAGRWIAYV